MEEAMEKLIKDKQDLSTYSSDTWDKWFLSKISGWVQSRLYLGDFYSPPIRQDFKMKYINKSWMDSKLCEKALKNMSKIKRRVTVNEENTILESTQLSVGEMTIFNSSTFANRSLLNIFRWNQKLRIKRQDSKVEIL
jgi:hypothetical protein